MMVHIRAMNKLDPKARANALQLLCEGMSIRAVTRVTGLSKTTVSKLVVDAGQAVERGPGIGARQYGSGPVGGGERPG
jgi:transposase-like protein